MGKYSVEELVEQPVPFVKDIVVSGYFVVAALGIHSEKQQRNHDETFFVNHSINI